MEHPWFKDWFNSPYYHLLYFNRDEKEAAAFIDKLIHYLKPALASRMLDVACGRGRHSIHLAEKGFDVTGIDLSEDSIAEALHHENDHLHFTATICACPFGSTILTTLLIFSPASGILIPGEKTITPSEPLQAV